MPIDWAYFRVLVAWGDWAGSQGRFRGDCRRLRVVRGPSGWRKSDWQAPLAWLTGHLPLPRRVRKRNFPSGHRLSDRERRRKWLERWDRVLTFPVRGSRVRGPLVKYRAGACARVRPRAGGPQLHQLRAHPGHAADPAVHPGGSGSGSILTLPGANPWPACGNSGPCQLESFPHRSILDWMQHYIAHVTWTRRLAARVTARSGMEWWCAATIFEELLEFDRGRFVEMRDLTPFTIRDCSHLWATSWPNFGDHLNLLLLRGWSMHDKARGRALPPYQLFDSGNPRG